MLLTDCFLFSAVHLGVFAPELRQQVSGSVAAGPQPGHGVGSPAAPVLSRRGKHQHGQPPLSSWQLNSCSALCVSQGLRIAPQRLRCSCSVNELHRLCGAVEQLQCPPVWLCCAGPAEQGFPVGRLCLGGGLLGSETNAEPLSLPPALFKGGAGSSKCSWGPFKADASLTYESLLC